MEVRSTGSPNRTGTAPAARKAASSSSAIPPSGPTTTQHVAGVGQRGRRRARSLAVLVQHQAGAPGEQLAHLGGAGQRSTTVGIRARRLCLAASRAVRRHFVQRLAPRAAPPLGHRPGRRPRDDLVHAQLGHHLDRQLAALALRQRLHDDQSRGSAAAPRRASDSQRQPVAGDRRDTGTQQRAVSVGDEHRARRRAAGAPWAACRPSSPVSR